jgi:selenide, water dikinase
LALLGQGLASSLHSANVAALSALVGEPGSELAALLVDPQTAGGLLAGVPVARTGSCLAELRRLGYRAAAIGVVAERTGDRPLVRLNAGCLDQPQVKQPATART